MSRSRNNPLTRISSSESVNLETGESTPIEGGGFQMLPGPPGTCIWCHVAHESGQPHNQQSLPYRMKFHAINGRSPTWTDAMAHCSKSVQQLWRAELVRTFRELGEDVPADLLAEGGQS